MGADFKRDGSEWGGRLQRGGSERGPNFRRGGSGWGKNSKDGPGPVMVIDTLCPAVHILGTENIYSKAKSTADHYRP